LKGLIMKLLVKSLALGVGLMLSAHGFAQTSVAAPTKPAASAAAAKNGATVANPVAPAATATTAAPAKSAAKPAAAAAPAAGGGDGKVWVNTASKVYHCAGTKYYGKTKAGEYMTEAEAKAKGNHANNKKACS
jgi:hypothetical protein